MAARLSKGSSVSDEEFYDSVDVILDPPGPRDALDDLDNAVFLEGEGASAEETEEVVDCAMHPEADASRIAAGSDGLQAGKAAEQPENANLVLETKNNKKNKNKRENKKRKNAQAGANNLNNNAEENSDASETSASASASASAAGPASHPPTKKMTKKNSMLKWSAAAREVINTGMSQDDTDRARRSSSGSSTSSVDRKISGSAILEDIAQVRKRRPVPGCLFPFTGTGIRYRTFGIYLEMNLVCK